MSDLKLMATSQGPSFLAISKNQLFAISEKNQGTLSSYQIADDTLQLINESSTFGNHPCYVGVDPSGMLAAVANYRSGDGAVIKILSDGSVGDTLFTYQHTGTGPNTNRQEAAHAHCSVFSPDGRFMYVVDLGIDRVMGYPTSGENVGTGFVALQLDPGDGPRHIDFHPTEPMVFVINELSNTVVSAAVVPVSGVFALIDKQSTLPADFTEHSQCADIHVSNDGQFLYASNRGHNSIAVYKVSTEGGLELVQIESVRGDWPRNFTLSPNEKFLLVANQNSGNIVVFQRDANSGKLTFAEQEFKMSKPVCLKF